MTTEPEISWKPQDRLRQSDQTIFGKSKLEKINKLADRLR